MQIKQFILTLSESQNFFFSINVLGLRRIKINEKQLTRIIFDKWMVNSTGKLCKQLIQWFGQRSIIS